MAEELSGQSANLSETMSFFKLGGQEAGAPEPVAVGPRRPEIAHIRQNIARGDKKPMMSLEAPQEPKVRGAVKPARLPARTGITPAGQNSDADFEEF
jgi:hypothetical protein